MYVKSPVIYIGYDEREDIAFEVAAESIRRTASKPINIVPLKQEALRRAGLYNRSHYNVGEQRYDCFDRKPFSTDFSFTRFLVPALNQYEGLALFMDCDMLIRSDVWELFDVLCKDQSKAVWCVHHDYNPTQTRKMDGKRQEVYNRKNWSSFVVWNCLHDSNKNLTISDVSVKDGSWLHSFSWLQDDEIGSIPKEWNWLDNWSPEFMEAKNAHFTTGGPQFSNWKPNRDADIRYAEEWKAIANNLKQEEALKGI